MTTDATVVVVSYRPGNWLGPCLESALAQAREVLVVDNGSPGEEASEIARRYGARPIRCRKNLGFAGGVAVGLADARGEIVGVLNDDAVAGPGWLDAATAVLADREVAAVTPKVVLAGPYREVVLEDEAWHSPGDARPLGRQLRSVRIGDKEVLASLVGAGVHDLEHGTIDGMEATWRWTAGNLPLYVPVDDTDDTVPVLFNGETVPVGPVVRVMNHAGSYLRSHGVAGEYGFGSPDDGRFDQREERFGFSGTAPVFRSETLTQLGGFAPEFFAYNEDTDWCLRARLAGMRVVYDPEASVTHRLSATSGGPREMRVRQLAQRNALLCLVRNAPREVARENVVRWLRDGPSGRVRREVVARLPWALYTRRTLQKLWVRAPHEVWDRWADEDTNWDVGPARSDA